MWITEWRGGKRGCVCLALIPETCLPVKCFTHPSRNVSNCRCLNQTEPNVKNCLTQCFCKQGLRMFGGGICVGCWLTWDGQHGSYSARSLPCPSAVPLTHPPTDILTGACTRIHVCFLCTRSHTPPRSTLGPCPCPHLARAADGEG